jgi:hypothetical protein
MGNDPKCIPVDIPALLNLTCQKDAVQRGILEPAEDEDPIADVSVPCS